METDQPADTPRQDGGDDGAATDDAHISGRDLLSCLRVEPTEVDDLMAAGEPDAPLERLLDRHRYYTEKLESIRHHTAYVDETRAANLTPGWLRVETDIRPPMSFRTDFDRQLEELTRGYQSQTLELVQRHYSQVRDQLKAELDTTETHIAAAIDAESNARTKSEKATMVREHATRMKRLQVEKRRNGKRRREAKLNDLKRPRPSSSTPSSSASSSKNKRRQRQPQRQQEHRLHSHGSTPTHGRTGKSLLTPTDDSESETDDVHHDIVGGERIHVAHANDNNNVSLSVSEPSRSTQLKTWTTTSRTRARRRKRRTRRRTLNTTRTHRPRVEHDYHDNYDNYHACTNSTTAYGEHDVDVLDDIRINDDGNAIESVHRDDSPTEHTNDFVVSPARRRRLSKPTTTTTTATDRRPDDRVGAFVVNRSGTTFTRAELSVLDKGLTFVPTETRPNRQRLLHEFDAFARKLRLRLHAERWETREEASVTPTATPPDDFANEHAYRLPTPPFRTVSKWQPPTTKNAALEAYVTRTRRALAESRPRHKIFQNLDAPERAALERLSRRTDVVMKKADKGSMIVVEDRRVYVENGLGHVDDARTYERLDNDPTPAITSRINRAISIINEHGLLDRDTLRHLIKTPSRVRTQQLYFLSKVHKNPVAYRPIVSGSSGPTEAISQYIDHLLKPIVLEQNSYIRDSGDFIRTLESTRIEPDATLVTIDVTSLYTNIPQDEGIRACVDMLGRHYGHDPALARIVEVFLHHILADNVFAFDGKIYRQRFGVAMGTRVAPTLANLFMARLEDRFIEGEPIKPRLWKRFIDDIFVVWEDTDAHLDAMLARLDRTHPTIKFTHAKSDTEAIFLDVHAYKGDRFRATGGILDTKTHFKPTNRFQYLDYASCHTAATKRAVVTGEANRFLRSTSDPIEYDRILTDHRRRLGRRGYPSRQTDSLLARLPHTRRTPPAAAVVGATREGCETRRLRQRDGQRREQTRPKRKRKRNRAGVVVVDGDGDGADVHEDDEDENRLILVTTHSPWFPDTGEIVRTEWQTMLSQDAGLRHTLGREPTIAYKRAKNIRDHITSARLKDVTVETEKTDVYDDSRAPPPPLEFTPQTTACGHAQCETCRSMTTSCAVRSTSTGRSHPIGGRRRDRLSCKSKNVIYVITCAIAGCHKQYVGQTGDTLRARMRHHRNKLRSWDRKKIYLHCNDRNHNPDGVWHVTPIQQETDHARRLDLEADWIRRLKTTGRFGLNKAARNTNGHAADGSDTAPSLPPPLPTATETTSESSTSIDDDRHYCTTTESATPPDDGGLAVTPLHTTAGPV